jgi:uncharacterized iron-regulated membrane protein
MSTPVTRAPTAWEQWRDHPEHIWIRRATFQVHLWIGAAVSLYVLLMSVSGSLLVFHRDYAALLPVQWLVDFHTNLSTGSTGRLVNGVGAVLLLVLCLSGAVIWWPGIRHWRRALTVTWTARFPRLTWDLHSALGFWGLALVAMWGLSAAYFVFPQSFDRLLVFDPGTGAVERALFWLSELHFGRLGNVMKAAWTVLGLFPAVLAFTGLFICCRRVMYGKPSNPKNAVD